MAASTLAGRAAIRYDTSAVDLAMLVVAEPARNIFVRSGQRKRAGGVVIK